MLTVEFVYVFSKISISCTLSCQFALYIVSILT